MGASDGLWAEGTTLKGPPDADGRRDRVRRALVLVAIVLLAANLRPAITSVAPLIGRIQAEAGVSGGVAGLLTALLLVITACLLAAGLGAGRDARVGAPAGAEGGHG